MTAPSERCARCGHELGWHGTSPPCTPKRRSSHVRFPRDECYGSSTGRSGATAPPTSAERGGWLATAARRTPSEPRR